MVSALNDFGGYVCPKVERWGRNAILPAVLEVGVWRIKPRPWGTWEKTDLELGSEETYLLHPSSFPQTFQLCPNLMINEPAFTFQSGRPPLTVAMAMRTSPLSIKEKKF